MRISAPCPLWQRDMGQLSHRTKAPSTCNSSHSVINKVIAQPRLGQRGNERMQVYNLLEESRSTINVLWPSSSNDSSSPLTPALSPQRSPQQCPKKPFCPSSREMINTFSFYRWLKGNSHSESITSKLQLGRNWRQNVSLKWYKCGSGSSISSCSFCFAD